MERGRGQPWGGGLSLVSLGAGGGAEAKPGAAEPVPAAARWCRAQPLPGASCPRRLPARRRGAPRDFSCAEASPALAGLQPPLPVSGERQPAAPSPSPGKRGSWGPRGARSPAVLWSPADLPRICRSCGSSPARGPATARWFAAFGGAGAAPSPRCLGSALRQAPAPPPFVAAGSGVPTFAAAVEPHSSSARSSR